MNIPANLPAQSTETDLATLGTSDIAAEIAGLAPWPQNLHLPDGTQTAPGLAPSDQPASIWERFRDFLPADLNGCEALEIGTQAGFYAIELARRGARVTAVESNPHFLRQASWAAAQHGLIGRIDLYQGHPYDLARWRGQHEIVLLLDQLHRLRYPLLALDIAAQLATRCLVVQVPATGAPVVPGGVKPALRDELPAPAGWVLDPTVIETMVRLIGFEIAAEPARGLYVCQPDSRNTRARRWTDPEFVSATGTMAAGLSPFHEESAPVALPGPAIAVAGR